MRPSLFQAATKAHPILDVGLKGGLGPGLLGSLGGQPVPLGVASHLGEEDHDVEPGQLGSGLLTK